MGYKCIVLLLLCVIITAGGCGGGGGGATITGDPNAVSGVSVAASKALVIANNADAATVTATVTRNAGGPAPDGTPVTFSVTGGTATLSNSSTSSTGGSATTTVKRVPVASPGTNESVTITATASSVTSAPVTVKFINKPDTATVRVGVKPALSNLGVLVFDLTPGSGATVSTVKGINEAASSNYVGFINPGVPSNTFTVLNAAGINVPANRDIVELTYAIGDISSLPTFQVTGNPTATSSTGTSIPVSATDFVVTTQFNTE